MRSEFAWALLIAYSFCACVLVITPDGDSTFEEQPAGSRGSARLQGEIDGEPISLKPIGGGFLFPDGRWEEEHLFEDGGWVFVFGRGTMMRGDTRSAELGLLHMPSNVPGESDWICAGTGSELSNYGTAGHEILLNDLSITGNCLHAPAGQLSATVEFSEDADSYAIGSEQLNLDGAQVWGIACSDECVFSMTIDNKRAVLWVKPTVANRRIDTPVPLEEASLIVPDRDGDYILACGGPDSTITRGDTFLQRVELSDVSIVGNCPGESISGKVLSRYIYDNE